MHSLQMDLHLPVWVALKLKRMMRTVSCVKLMETQSLSSPGSKMDRRCPSHRQGVTVETILSKQPTNTELQITRYMLTSYVSNYDDSPATTIIQIIMNIIICMFFQTVTKCLQNKVKRNKEIKQQSKKDKITLIKPNNNNNGLDDTKSGLLNFCPLCPPI